MPSSPKSRSSSSAWRRFIIICSPVRRTNKAPAFLFWMRCFCGLYLAAMSENDISLMLIDFIICNNLGRFSLILKRCSLIPNKSSCALYRFHSFQYNVIHVPPLCWKSHMFNDFHLFSISVAVQLIIVAFYFHFYKFRCQTWGSRALQVEWAVWSDSHGKHGGPGVLYDADFHEGVGRPGPPLMQSLS